MKITYLGHSSFVFESGGTRLLLDPFDATAGYAMAPVTVDAVYASHDHFDHNFVARAAGSPRVIRALTSDGKAWATVDERVGPFRIRTVATYHDDAEGAKRGKNGIALIEAEGLRLAHAGDLGHPLSEERAAAVGTPDVVLDYLDSFGRHAAADELIVAHQSTGTDARLRSVELLAEAAGLARV